MPSMKPVIKEPVIDIVFAWVCVLPLFYQGRCCCNELRGDPNIMRSFLGTQLAMKQIVQGFSDFFRSIYLYLELFIQWEEDFQDLFWASLIGGLHHKKFGQLNVMFSIDPPLEIADEIFALSWYFSEADREVLLNEGIPGRSCRVLGFAKHEGKDVVICEIRKSIFVYDIEKFNLFFKRMIDERTQSGC